MGYVVSTEEVIDIDENGKLIIEHKHKRFKFDLCFANIELFAEIEHTPTGHRLHYFFYDNEHLKRIIKAEGENAKYFLANRHYYFNAFYSCPNKTTVRLLTQMGAKVSFFYKDPNTKKKGKKKNK